MAEIPYKFNRIYNLKLTTSTNEIVEIKNPITCELTISRKNLASLNTANFVIYNLNQTTRNKIYKDIFDLQIVKPIEFWAGYKYDKTTFLSRCFAGEIKQAYSVRDGCDYKTFIECWDGGKAASMGILGLTMPSGTSIKTQIIRLAQSMPNIIGAVVSDQFKGTSARGTTFLGNQLDALSQLTEGCTYIDNQTVYCLKQDDVLQGEVETIDKSFGLLDTPQRSQTLVELSMLFEPRLFPSQKVTVISDVEAIYNGTYKLTGIDHTGIISDAVNGELKTKVTLLNVDIRNVIRQNIINYLKNNP